MASPDHPIAMTSKSAAVSALTRVATAVLRAGLALFAMLLMIGALVLGIAVAAGVVVWALLRGRRPGPVNLRWGTGRMPRPGAHRPAGEVVDVASREIDPKH